ncbi:general secretion pathway protein GspB [Caldimonas sp. KR1-144]|uniref:general secretion pathway protein GspB n=1 Tax=Caldimonas sp. KR1-144 TaxID=3400911 RepID=UPI003C0850C8
MSYILDALRRSDAEREREQAGVPKLFTQQAAGPLSRADPAVPRERPVLLWVMIGIALGLAAPALWFALGRSGPDPMPVPQATGHGPTTMPAMPAPPNAAPRSQPQPEAVPRQAAEPRPLERAALPTAPQGPGPHSLAIEAAAMPARQPADEPSRTAPRTPPRALAPTPPPAAKVESSERIPKLSELPESLRRELPPLAFGGAVYSDTPSARFVILNGLIHREQDRVAPDLVVEQIKLKAAVLRYRDQRFEITF